MGTTIIELPVEQAEYRSTNFPQLLKYNGTNAPIFALLFDATADEAVFFNFVANRYGSGNVTVELDWFADSATSGNVVLGASIGCITADTDTTDTTTKALGTEATVTDSHLGTTGKRLHRASVTITSLDSIAVNDRILLRIRRLGSSGSDTMTGDLALVGIRVTYSDV